jgi:hypothetical protein
MSDVPFFAPAPSTLSLVASSWHMRRDFGVAFPAQTTQEANVRPSNRNASRVFVDYEA